MKSLPLPPRSLSGDVDCSLKFSTIHLRKLAAEVRIMVYGFSMKRENGKTPAFLIALRKDPGLYAEALEVYYKINEFKLVWDDARMPGTLKWFEGLKNEVKLMVKGGITVVLPSYNIDAALDEDVEDESKRRLITTQKTALLSLLNITSLKIVGNNIFSIDRASIGFFFFKAKNITPDALRQLQKLELIIGKNNGGIPNISSMFLTAALGMELEEDLRRDLKGVFEEKRHKKYVKWSFTAEKGGVVEFDMMAFIETNQELIREVAAGVGDD